MTFRVAFLNMEQDHRRWDARRHLIADQLVALAPDVFAMNEISVPRQTGRWVQAQANDRLAHRYALVQQSKTNMGSVIEGEGLIARFPVLETGNLDYRTEDYVALVARLEIEGWAVDVYVTHLYKSRGDESLRVFQVRQLLAWIHSRDDSDAQIVCGDFNAAPDKPAARLMAESFTATQSAPTAFTPLANESGGIAHDYWPRMDRSIDYIWLRGPLKCVASEVCFDVPAADDPSLWPSDHAGLWADIAWA